MSRLVQNPLIAFNLFAILLALRDAASHKLLLDDVPPLFMLLVFCLVTGAVTWLEQWRTSGSPALLRPFFQLKASERWTFLKLGVTTCIAFALTFFGIKFLGAAIFSMIEHGLMPIITVALGIFMFRDRLTLPMAVGGAISILGVTLFLSPDIEIAAGREELYLGIAFSIASAFLTSLTSAYQKRLVDAQVPFRLILLYRFLIPALLLAGLVIPEGIPVAPEQWPALILVGIVGFTLPLLLLCYGFMKASIARFSAYIFLIPVYTFLVGPILVEGEIEKLTQPAVLLGTGLVLAGYVVAEELWRKVWSWESRKKPLSTSASQPQKA